MSRAAIQTLIANDGTLRTLGVPVGGVYGSNAPDTPADDVFAVIRWEEVTSAFNDRGSQAMTVWVYDRRGTDYTLVDAMIRRVKDLLLGAVHLVGSDGMIFTCAVWNGSSGDLQDDVWDAIARNTSFTVSSRPAE